MRAFDAHRGTARGPVALEPSSRVTEPAFEDDDSRASACVARVATSLFGVVARRRIANGVDASEGHGVES